MKTLLISIILLLMLGNASSLCAQPVGQPTSVASETPKSSEVRKDEFFDLLEVRDRQIAQSVTMLSADLSFFSTTLAYISIAAVALFTVLTAYEIWKIRNLEGRINGRIDRERDRIGSDMREEISRARQFILDDVQTKARIYVSDYVNQTLRTEMDFRMGIIESAYVGNMALVEDVIEKYLVNEWEPRWESGKRAQAHSDFHKFRAQLTYLLGNDLSNVNNALSLIQNEHLDSLSVITTDALQRLLCKLQRGRLAAPAVHHLVRDVLEACQRKTGYSCAHLNQILGVDRTSGTSSGA